MALFAGADETVRVLSTLGIHKSDDVATNIVRVISPDYDVGRRSILYRAGISTTETEQVIRQRYTQLVEVRNLPIRPSSQGTGSRRRWSPGYAMWWRLRGRSRKQQQW